MALDTSLLNSQQYKVGIKGKTEQSRERSRALPDTSLESSRFFRRTVMVQVNPTSSRNVMANLLVFDIVIGKSSSIQD